jgi:hypothetical protein
MPTAEDLVRGDGRAGGRHATANQTYRRPFAVLFATRDYVVPV